MSADDLGLTVLCVGEPAPWPDLPGDGSTLRYQDLANGVPMFWVVRMTSPSSREVDDFAAAGWWFRMVSTTDPRDPVTLLAQTKGKALWEATYTAGLCSAETLAEHALNKAEADADSTLRHVVTAVLVDERNVIRAMAQMTWSPKFTRAFEHAVARQVGPSAFDREDYLRRLAAQPSVRALWAKGSRIYCKAGE